jgi:hypothetical protein
MVPEGADPLDLYFTSNAPVDTKAAVAYLPLRRVDGTSYIMEFTDISLEAGQPGLILPVPELSFSWWEPRSIAEGRYRIGIACTPASSFMVDRYWDTVIEVTHVEDGPPDDWMRWSAAEPGGASGEASAGDIGSSNRMMWPLLLIPALVVGLVRVRRAGWRRHSTTPETTETR